MRIQLAKLPAELPTSEKREKLSAYLKELLAADQEMLRKQAASSVLTLQQERLDIYKEIAARAEEQLIGQLLSKLR